MAAPEGLFRIETLTLEATEALVNVCRPQQNDCEKALIKKLLQEFGNEGFDAVLAECRQGLTNMTIEISEGILSLRMPMAYVGLNRHGHFDILFDCKTTEATRDCLVALKEHTNPHATPRLSQYLQKHIDDTEAILRHSA
jgi:hypothetical protein